MNNLEKIKAAWAMGWAATLKFQDDLFHGFSCQILGIRKNEPPDQTLEVAVEWDNEIEVQDLEDLIEDAEITGYLYAGQLAGNEPIPEGQRFRVRKEKRLMTYYQSLRHNSVIILKNEKEDFIHDLDKSEIEPVFD